MKIYYIRIFFFKSLLDYHGKLFTSGCPQYLKEPYYGSSDCIRVVAPGIGERQQLIPVLTLQPLMSTFLKKLFVCIPVRTYFWLCGWRSLLAGLEGPYLVPGIEPRSPSCEANTIPCVPLAKGKLHVLLKWWASQIWE